MTHRRLMFQSGGFTLVELLVVISIIALLGSLIMVSLAGVRDRQLLLQANRDLDGLTLAVGQYMTDHGFLGNEIDSSDFVKSPLRFLSANPRLREQPLYFDPEMGRIIRGNEHDGIIEDALGYLDPWGSPFRVFIETRQFRGISSPENIIIYSYAGDGKVGPRTLARQFVVGTGNWVTIDGDTLSTILPTSGE